MLLAEPMASAMLRLFVFWEFLMILDGFLKVLDDPETYE